jgi:sn-glycerol 3-phosphate transport system ATP-binding protein
MATIDLVNVKKTYAGGNPVVHGIDLAIADGELLVLVGPSGCGKSTLLRMIAGLETITEGSISIGGGIVNNKEPAERDIAMVFQNYALYPHMTVRQNLEYGLKNRGTDKAVIAERIEEAARILEIAPFLERKPRQLSGGQRQRVAMGRAIVRHPKAFLFDEPLSNLDAKLRGQMRIEIRRLQRTLGTTSVYVTHDQLEAMTLADRLVVMNAGRVEQIGAPIDVYEKPASIFVASFIGSPAMNLLSIETLKALGVTIPEALPANTGTIGIRPEEITLEARGAEDIRLNAILDAVELVGSESLLYARAPGYDKELVLRVQGTHAGKPGDAITLNIRLASVHPFHQETGRRI